MNMTALGLFVSGALFGGGLVAWVAFMGCLFYWRESETTSRREGLEP